MRVSRDDLFSAIIVVAAVVLAAAAVDRQFLSQTTPASGQADGKPMYIANWTRLLEAGVHVGDSAARVKILTFSDLECPFCRRFHDTAQELAATRGDVSLVFLHYPLNGHRFARPGAVAAECAFAHDRFAQFVDTVYAQQDSLGLKGWTALASEAGISDTLSFRECLGGNVSPYRLERGIELGSELGVRGTPTVIVNGWRFAVPPYESLATAVDQILAGRKPFAR